MLLYLHLINFMIFFHLAKFDNFKDETISDYKTVSVPQSQILAGHSMAKDNFNKSKETTPTTSASLMVAP